MRLFRSNKSQSSIDRFNPSREGSPTHPESNAYPPPASAAPLTQRYPAGPSQYDGVSDPQEQRRYRESDQPQTHPAHQITRSQSHRAGAGGIAAYSSPAKPSVHIVGPSSPAGIAKPPNHEEQRFQPPPLSQLQPVAPEKERRKSKRSIFGLHSSSKESREASSPTSPLGQSKEPGRRGSLLRRAQPGQQGLQQPLTISGPYPQTQPGSSSYQQQSREALYHSQESLTDSDDKTPNETIYQGQDRFDQSQSQLGGHSERQLQGDHRYSQQALQQYQSDRGRRSEESAETYLAYQQQQEGQEEDPTGPDSSQFRPPSQLSLLSPPSPGTQSGDSRPSSATNASQHSRFSTQSAVAIGPLSQQQQQHIAMARGDPPPNGLREQMNQQRDPRLQEPGHGQYVGQQDPRSRASQHVEQGRGTPPPRNREDIGSLDFQTLLQRYEELRKSESLRFGRPITKQWQRRIEVQ